MKIAILGPNTQIPPIGWGAVEILIWDIKCTLEQLGHEVLIVNTNNGVEILQKVNSFSPDFVYIEYDDLIEIYNYIQYPCAITTHFAYLTNDKQGYEYKNRVLRRFQEIKPNVFCLSTEIIEVYKKLGINSSNLFLTPNGVNTDRFTFLHTGTDTSLYLGKIDCRKRQYMFQSINSLFYAGNVIDNRFDKSKNYLGEWNKEQLYRSLTLYGNLVLLSDGEAHPLVCMEAMAAGLGLVISEYATANLDLSKPFIDVIPESKINDMEYVESVIINNRNISLSMRNNIREYSKQFKWDNMIQKYYIPNMKNIIDRYN